MVTSTYAIEVAARLVEPAERSEEFAKLLLALLRELAKGRPVSSGALASTLGWSASRVVALLEQQPCTEYDEQGNVVGYGITLNETAHALEVDGQRLYTWCALDALMFPVMIGKAARVLSCCAASGHSVSLRVSPDGVRDLKPASAVVSFPPADAVPDIRRSFCCHVNFYASAAAACRSTHENMELVGAEEAFGLGRLIAALLTNRAAAAPQA